MLQRANQIDLTLNMTYQIDYDYQLLDRYDYNCNTCMWAGLVLMNSAGLLVNNYKAPESKEAGSTAMGQLMSGPPAFVVDAITSALLFYLEKTIGRTLKRAYPVNPGMADAWLTEEIARAAGDLGAKQVFRQENFLYFYVLLLWAYLLCSIGCLWTWMYKKR